MKCRGCGSRLVPDREIEKKGRKNVYRCPKCGCIYCFTIVIKCTKCSEKERGKQTIPKPKPKKRKKKKKGYLSRKTK